MRLIDADEIMQRLSYNNGTPTVEYYNNGDPVTFEMREIKGLIRNAPTVSPWVKTADRLPTESDADSELMIMAWHIYFGYEAVAYGSVIDEPEMFTYWMPTAPLPEAIK